VPANVTLPFGLKGNYIHVRPGLTNWHFNQMKPEEKYNDYVHSLLGKDHSKEIAIVEVEIQSVLSKYTKNGLMPFITFDVHADHYNFSPWVVKMSVVGLEIAPMEEIHNNEEYNPKDKNHLSA
jgi:hypothetical protein